MTNSMFKTPEDITEYILSQDISVADKALDAYNVAVDYIKPVTMDQREDILWDVLEAFNLI